MPHKEEVVEEKMYRLVFTGTFGEFFLWHVLNGVWNDPTPGVVYPASHAQVVGEKRRADSGWPN